MDDNQREHQLLGTQKLVFEEPGTSSTKDKGKGRRQLNRKVNCYFISDPCLLFTLLYIILPKDRMILRKTLQ